MVINETAMNSLKEIFLSHLDIDFDECSSNVDTCDDATSTCQNIDGDYNCTCNAGYANTSPKQCQGDYINLNSNQTSEWCRDELK